MHKCRHFLPGFKVTYILIGTLYILLSGSLFMKGLMKGMAEFKVPDAILQSPHYYDAILWVYTHMMVLGVILLVIGIFSHEERFRLWLSRALFLLHIVYTWFDLRSSDSALGNGLYAGEASVVPAIIALIFTLLFLHLSFCRKP